MKITLSSENLAVACFKMDIIDVGDNTNIYIPYIFQEFEGCICICRFAALLSSPLLGKDAVERNLTRGGGFKGNFESPKARKQPLAN